MKNIRRSCKMSISFLLLLTFLAGIFPAQMVAADSNSASVTLQVHQEFTVTKGKETEPDQRFTYRLTALDADNPMPAGSSDGAYDFAITGSTTFKLGPMSYSRVGVYQYRLEQIVDQQKAKYTYDMAKYMITVYVKNGENGGLITEVIAQNSKSEKVGELKYSNSWRGTIVEDEDDANYEFIKMADSITVKAGQTVVYTLTGFGNKRGKELTNYEIADRPDEGINFISAKLPAFTNGAGVTYDIVFYTSLTGRRVLYSDVPADQAFDFKVPELAAGDRVTGVVFSFTKVPAGFGKNDSIVLTFKIADEPPQTKLVNHAGLSYDLDGKHYDYNGTNDNSTVKVTEKVTQTTYKSGKTMPKTGDNTRIWLYAVLMIAGLTVMLTAITYHKRKKKQE